MNPGILGYSQNYSSQFSMPLGLTGRHSGFDSSVTYDMTPQGLQDANQESAVVLVIDLTPDRFTTGSANNINRRSPNYAAFFPVAGSNLTFYWGDGSYSNLSPSSAASGPTHAYSAPGTYIVKILGNVTALGLISNIYIYSRILSFGRTTGNITYSGRSAVLVELPYSLPTGVTSLLGLAANAIMFNQNLSSWNTSNITSMAQIFQGCTNLNQPFNSWNTEKVTTMNSAFLNCSSLNQSFAGWNTSSVTNFSSMFNGCSSLNQDFSMWNFSSCTNLTNFMTGVTLNTAYYDALLILWNTYKNDWFAFGSSMTPNMGSSKYSAGAAATARASLITKGWSITDGGPA